MADQVEGLAITTWYKAVVAVGALALAAAITASEHAIAIVACGAIIIGVGEWINHPRRISIRGNLKITDVSRETNAVGIAVDLVGLGTILFGIYKMVQ